MLSIRQCQLYVLTVFTLTLSAAFGSSSALESNLPSSVRGVSIRNAHKIYKYGNAEVYRGQAPKQKEFESLFNLGIRRFVIYKNDTLGEVAKEIAYLKSQGVNDKDILHLEMPWKDDAGFQNTCQMTLQALRFIEDSMRKQQSVYFHCTMGEDRTGMLAGLWGLWVGTYPTVDKAFREEMCARGYEGGNPKKPYMVLKLVREALTPNFFKMVELLAQARQEGKNLTHISCPTDVTLTRNLNWTCR